MYYKMPYKTVFENVISFITGLFGGGVFYTLQIAWHDEVLKFISSGITALIMGGMGVAGKYIFVWTWKKIKSFTSKK